MKRLILAVAAALLVWLYGAIHVVHGEKVGLATCWKVGWSLGDTFVDLDQVKDSSSPKVLDALDHCTIEPDPGAWNRDRFLLFVLAGGGLILAAELAYRRSRRRAG